MGQSVGFARKVENDPWHRMLPGLGTVTVRTLSLADWDAYRTFAERIECNDMRLRFAGPVKLDASRCRRFLDIDHDREEAFAAFDGEGAMLGVARLARTSETEGEIALIVRSDLKRRGVGTLLLDRLIRHADAAGVGVLTGDVLYENLAMLSLARRSGFSFIGNAGLLVAIRMVLDPGMAPPLAPPAAGRWPWAARA
ncbi:MAG TPA: GNAT family N-acetyltransferase [Xanthobacteraceae bacterium]|nr:GNAT family N-acetyltransferase [Xanthobacteraceae bacterium]